MKKIVVTKIINKYEVLLNVGSEDGITIHSIFEIVGSEHITDPISKENLGTLNYTKAKLQVKKLMPKMCICEDYNNRIEDEYTSRLISAPIFQHKIIKNELNLDIDDYVEEQIDTSIYVGDEVKLIH